jgi:hypothetical protein
VDGRSGPPTYLPDRERFCRIPQKLLLAIESAGLPRAELLVALHLLYRTYQWTPVRADQVVGYDELTRHTGLHRRSVIRAVHQLETRAVITAERRRRAPRVNEVNLYRINPPEWWRTRHYLPRVETAENVTRTGDTDAATPGGADATRTGDTGVTLRNQRKQESREAALSEDSLDGAKATMASDPRLQWVKRMPV